VPDPLTTPVREQALGSTGVSSAESIASGDAMPDAGARQVDRIDSAARWTQEDVDSLNNRFADSTPQEMLAAVIKENLVGTLAVVSSFGTESAVLLHLVASVDPSVEVLFLETGKHFPETLSYRDDLVAHLGLQNLTNLYPDLDKLQEKDENGLRWSYDPDGCCEIRKVEPLNKHLVGYGASITGRKGFQSDTRNGLPRFELDSTSDGMRLKINPLANWDKDRLEAYFEAHDLPRHPLEADGYPSIGCAPCTSRVAPGEDPRSGRWKGWDKVECGIHDAVTPDSEAPDDGSYDPVF